MKPFCQNYLIILFLLVSASISLAQDISVLATVDKNPANLGDIITLTVEVNGTQKISTPQLPDLSGFSIRNRSTSSSVRIVNGSMSSSVSYIYQIIAKKPGAYNWLPIRIKIDKKIYESKPLSITILPASSNSSKPGSYAFAKLSISNSKPYVNEQTNLTFKLYRRVDARNIRLDWKFNSFRHKDLGKPREYTEVIEGLKYIIYEINTALFGHQPGAFKVGPVSVELDLLYPNMSSKNRSPFDSFFNDPFFGRGRRGEHKVLITNIVPIEIQPYPQLDKPEDFQGLTGRYIINASIRKKQLETGDTTTLNVSVRGTGNVENAEIKLPQLNKIFKIYPDQPQFQESISSQIVGGEKIFKLALVPLIPGVHIIPPIKLTFFEPELKKYKTVETKPLSLNVVPSQKKEQLKITTSQIIENLTPEIKILGKDILPNHTQLEDFENYAFTDSIIFYYGIALIAPPLLCVSIFFYIQLQRRMNQDLAFSRPRRAYKNARQKLLTMQNNMKGDSKTIVRSLSQVLREYIGDKMNLSGTAFTTLETEQKMKQRRFSENQIMEARRLLEKYEAIQYGMIESISSKELFDEIQRILTQLEKTHE